MREDIKDRVIKKDNFPYAYFPNASEIGKYCVAAEFVEDLDAGHVVIFYWEERCYSTGRDRNGAFWIFDWGDGHNNRSYPSARLLLEGAVLANGDRLRDVILDMEVESIT